MERGSEGASRPLFPLADLCNLYESETLSDSIIVFVPKGNSGAAGDGLSPKLGDGTPPAQERQAKRRRQDGNAAAQVRPNVRLHLSRCLVSTCLHAFPWLMDCCLLLCIQGQASPVNAEVAAADTAAWLEGEPGGFVAVGTLPI